MQYLDDMIDCKIKGVLVVGDIGHASEDEAHQLRLDLITPLYTFVDKEPEPRKSVLKSHLDNLLGKGLSKFSLQEFYKVWSILEVITALVGLFVSECSTLRDIDVRKVKLIIDDQCKASLITPKEFVCFFVWSRSRDGRFNCSSVANGLVA